MYAFIFMGFSCVCCMCIFISILYESVHLQNVFLYFKLYIYKVSQEFLCEYVLILYTVNFFLCGIA
jgi:hypothetical protein